MRQYIEQAIEDIDAAIFSGDAFVDKDARKEMRETLARWERRLKQFDPTPEELAQMIYNEFDAHFNASGDSKVELSIRSKLLKLIQENQNA